MKKSIRNMLIIALLNIVALILIMYIKNQIIAILIREKLISDGSRMG